MKTLIYGFVILTFLFYSCSKKTDDKITNMKSTTKIVFLHHSTGAAIWKGDVSRVSYKIFKKGSVSKWFDNFNRKEGKDYQIIEKIFPSKEGYGWKNYPYDYYTLWVMNEGQKYFMNEPTLELLSKSYDVIVFKHCFPVSSIKSDIERPDIDSEEKRIENYKLQYEILKLKMHQFPSVKFIVWTGAALTKASTSEEDALRSKEFFTWVKNEWDEKSDNIFIWDFYDLQTEGDIYFNEQYAKSSQNSHPNSSFAGKVAPLFCNRIVDVIEGRGDSNSLTGK